MLWNIILGSLTVLSLVLTLWQAFEAWRFPLHRRVPSPSRAPAVTLLKPLKGCDEETSECLKSWLNQDYDGPVQLLFGVADAQDPVCDLVRELIASSPGCDARLVICPDDRGPNAKVSTLIQLLPHAGHEVVIVSDADVRVPAAFLVEAVAPLSDARVGLVNCFYQLSNASNLAMRWEGFAANADFWSQVLQARRLKPLDFALGAVMATTRQQLSKIGGFEALVDYLADDYRLGNLLAKTGVTIGLCPVVVECRSSPTGWKEVWDHQVRWARTIRVCQPGPYFASLLSNATLWPLLWILGPGGEWALSTGGVCLLARMGTGYYCEGKLTRRFSGSSLAVVLLKDLLQIPVWALAFLGNRITWRGRRFEVAASGKLVKVR